MKNKGDELGRQLKKKRETDSLGSINFNDLCTHPSSKNMTGIVVIISTPKFMA